MEEIEKSSDDDGGGRMDHDLCRLDVAAHVFFCLTVVLFGNGRSEI